MNAAPLAPPAFAWEQWYAAVGGRSINIEEVTAYLRQIYDDQSRRFDGEVAPVRRSFESPGDAARHLKEQASRFGADIVGICEIEPSDIYRGRTVTEKFAVAVNCEDDPIAGVLPLTATDVSVGFDGALGAGLELPHAHSKKRQHRGN